MSEESSLPIINISSQDTNLIHQDPGTNSGEVQNIITAIPETEHVEPNDITFIDKESVGVEPILTLPLLLKKLLSVTLVSILWKLRK